jgi:hypothetical protein
VLIIGISTIYPAGSGGRPSAAYAAAERFTDVEKIPIDTTVFLECAAGGSGEAVHLTGEEYDVFYITFVVVLVVVVFLSCRLGDCIY